MLRKIQIVKEIVKCKYGIYKRRKMCKKLNKVNINFESSNERCMEFGRGCMDGNKASCLPLLNGGVVISAGIGDQINFELDLLEWCKKMLRERLVYMQLIPHQVHWSF